MLWHDLHLLKGFFAFGDVALGKGWDSEKADERSCDESFHKFAPVLLATGNTGLGEGIVNGMSAKFNACPLNSA